VTSRWFKWGKVSFLIGAIDPDVVLSLDRERKKGRLTDEQMRKEIFSSVLLEWDGPGDRETFWNDLNFRDFVLQEATYLLEKEVEEWKRVHDLIERRLLETG